VRPGHTIHFGHKTMRVVGVRHDDADSPPVLVVEDVVLVVEDVVLVVEDVVLVVEDVAE
jgi:hypothetical protein